MGRTKTIKVGALARVEGEGALKVRTQDGEPREVRLEIFEPPRFFEAFLQGRSCLETPDVTARICGICPVAYQMSAVSAVEDGCGVMVDGALRDLRRLLYCGEWIESHVLHIAMLHAPDFLGYPDAMTLAQDHPGPVERSLQMKKTGNAIVSLLGGREIHPINVRVGGFYRVPTRKELAGLEADLEKGLESALASLEWTAGFSFPDLERDYELVSVSHPTEYPMLGDRIVSTHGVDIPVHDFDQTFEEIQVPHSTAFHARVKGRGPYLAGPLARWANNSERLHETAREAAAAAGLTPDCRNPFKTILARGVEVIHAFAEALQLVRSYEPPSAPAVSVPLRAATGYGCTEAPRGLLYHRYEFDEEGTIQTARIVPPTSQNQSSIEDDIRLLLPRIWNESHGKIRHLCEQAIRNHDPCISCSTHFLRLDIEPEEPNREP